MVGGKFVKVLLPGMSKLNVAIIGAGYWGKNLIRVFYSFGNDVVLKYVCDLDEKKLKSTASFYPSVIITASADDIFKDTEIDAVVIATQVASHYCLAKKALLAGKHVLVEKPMTKTVAEAEELVMLAKEKNLILMVDYTFLYTGAVRKIRELVSSGEIGQLRYFDSERINLGLIQPDVNVLYDLAVHDLSIINFISGENPISLHAHGASFVTRGRERAVEEISHLHLAYPSGFLAHVHSSWLSPVKMRKMVIGGDKKMILYDDIEPSEKIKVYDHGVGIDFESETPDIPIYRSGDVIIPKIDNSEALAAEAREFVDSIKNNRKPLSGGEEGLAVVKILEAAEFSMRDGGNKIIL